MVGVLRLVTGLRRIISSCSTEAHRMNSAHVCHFNCVEAWAINAFCRISVFDIMGVAVYKLAPLFVLLILIRQSACQNSSKVNCPTWPRFFDEWIKWYTMISSGTAFGGLDLVLGLMGACLIRIAMPQWEHLVDLSSKMSPLLTVVVKTLKLSASNQSETRSKL